jgi:two-component system response regulator RegA
MSQVDEIEDLTGRALLVVDDDDVFRARLARAMRSRGFGRVFEAPDYAGAMALARAEPIGLATVDLRMPGEGGLELVRDLLSVRPGALVVVLTGYGSIATAVEAIQLGAAHYLPKPADADDVLNAFLRASSPPLDPPAPTYTQAPSLERAEWEHINRVLADCGGNISEAARRLGIHRRSLQRKLQRFPPQE